MVSKTQIDQDESRDQLEQNPANNKRVPPDEALDEQNNADSNTNVYLGKNSAVGIWGNERGLHTLRCDNGIWKAFKSATKALGSSICSTAETVFLGVIASYETMQENNVHLGNTFNIEMDVYRQLGRDRRKVNPDVVIERDVSDKKVGNLRDVAEPFIEYYLARPSLNPSDRQLYADFKREGLELDWEVKQALATFILRKIREARK
jgi:hypothetical protein